MRHQSDHHPYPSKKITTKNFTNKKKIQLVIIILTSLGNRELQASDRVDAVGKGEQGGSRKGWR